MKYQNIHPINKSKAESIFDSNDLDQIKFALVAVAFYEQDWKWAQDICLRFFLNTDSTVSGLAATCLGHIARVHGTLDKDKVIAVLLGKQKDPEISGRIQDAIDDIEQFIR